MNRTTTAISALLVSGAGAQITVTERDGALDIAFGDELFTTYHYSAEPRPYLHPVTAPGNLPVTRGWPADPQPNEQHDHPHHQSLWFAHGDVNGHDFWHGGESAVVFDGLLEHESGRSSESPRAAPEQVVVRTRHRWIDPAGQTVCIEHRRMTFIQKDTSRVVRFEIRLEAAEDDVVFGDTKEGTMALRLAPTLRLRGPVAAGSIRNSEGDENGDCWGKRADWVAYSGPVQGRTVTVAMFDHPDNPRHPTWWHARDYGLFAANPFGIHDFEKKPDGTGDLTVSQGESLLLRYTVLVAAEQLNAAQLDESMRGFGE